MLQLIAWNNKLGSNYKVFIIQDVPILDINTRVGESKSHLEHKMSFPIKTAINPKLLVFEHSHTIIHAMINLSKKLNTIAEIFNI